MEPVTVTDDEKTSRSAADTIKVRVVEDLAYEDEDCDGAFPRSWSRRRSTGSGRIMTATSGTSAKRPRLRRRGRAARGDGSWEAGVNGAHPGIVMLADPDNGDQYHQEFAEGFAEDQAKVMDFNGMPVLGATTPSRPEMRQLHDDQGMERPRAGSIEQKTYCPAAGGLVLVEEHSGKLVRFELTDGGAAAAGADAFTFRVPKQ